VPDGLADFESASGACVVCVMAIASGWATYNEFFGDGGLNQALQSLLAGLGELSTAMAVVFIHVGQMASLRVWRDP
jgi:hypothetical protein